MPSPFPRAGSAILLSDDGRGGGPSRSGLGRVVIRGTRSIVSPFRVRSARWMAAKRPRHQRDDLEKLIRTAEEHGWRVTRRKGYYRAQCPCRLCQESVVLTPSDPNYARNKLNKMSKCPKWEV